MIPKMRSWILVAAAFALSDMACAQQDYCDDKPYYKCEGNALMACSNIGEGYERYMQCDDPFGVFDRCVSPCPRPDIDACCE
jgi:hypothetical protein